MDESLANVWQQLFGSPYNDIVLGTCLKIPLSDWFIALRTIYISDNHYFGESNLKYNKMVQTF